jgi:hypothetical protein
MHNKWCHNGYDVVYTKHAVQQEQGISGGSPAQSALNSDNLSFVREHTSAGTDPFKWFQYKRTFSVEKKVRNKLILNPQG